ncbi:ABC transporter ATP-binding protein, partial [Streptomyces sp. sk2.1]
MQRLTADSVTLGYDRRVIAENLSVGIPDNS